MNQDNGEFQPISRVRKFIVFGLMLVCAVALGFIIYNITTSMMAARANQVLRTVAFSPVESTAAPVQNADSNEASSDEDSSDSESENPSVEVVYDSPINFVALQRINPDIYSWIEIADTPISYAVLQDDVDYLYYLNHTFDNQYNSDGSIFSQDITRRDYMDAVTILYGHNLRNREMFGSLREYRNEDYMLEHRTITIYTPTETLNYTVFAAVTYTNDLITAQYDLNTDEGVQAFLDNIFGLRDMGNVFLDDVEVTTEDRILVLSTCNGNSSQRYLVLAVLEEN